MPPGESHCPACGFPVTLSVYDLGPPGPPADGGLAHETEPPPPGRAGSRGAAPPPEAELSDQLGRTIVNKMGWLGALGPEAPDVTNELCEAALGEAAGRYAEALAVLRAAQARLDLESLVVVRRRLSDARARREALQRTGFRLDAGLDLPDPASLTEGVDLAPLIDRVRDIETRLVRLESDTTGVRRILDEIESLRQLADHLGIPPGDVPRRVASIRTRLSGDGLSEESMDAIVEDAAATLMMLHESIPSTVEEELARHGTSLAGAPPTHPALEGARRHHAEASRHLKAGRLSDAVRSVRELRAAILELERHPAPAPPTAVPPPSPTTPPEAASPPPKDDRATLTLLLQKARTLAARVRALPPDSESARTAATQIREATELLKARRLEDADRALTRLMRSLSYSDTGP